MSKHGEIVGIPWFLPADYTQVTAMMTDGAHLPPSYDGWLEEAEAAERRVRDGGQVPARAVIDPFEFSIWCRDQATQPDEAARDRFAAWVASRQDDGY